jgi:hypothetical protein
VSKFCDWVGRALFLVLQLQDDCVKSHGLFVALPVAAGRLWHPLPLCSNRPTSKDYPLMYHQMLKEEVQQHNSKQSQLVSLTQACAVHSTKPAQSHHRQYWSCPLCEQRAAAATQKECNDSEACSHTNLTLKSASAAQAHSVGRPSQQRQVSVCHYNRAPARLRLTHLPQQRLELQVQASRCC